MDPDPATSGPATTGPAGDTGMVTVGDPDDGGSNDPAVQMCLDQATNECEDCACMSCLPQLQACEQDPGCVAIRMCAQQSGCTGIECLGPCGDVINANGGALGPSAGLASALSDCVEGSCPAC
jgi:hypothetical protein